MPLITLMLDDLWNCAGVKFANLRSTFLGRYVSGLSFINQLATTACSDGHKIRRREYLEDGLTN